MRITFTELANLVDKPLNTVAKYFSRHGLSIKREADIRLYLRKLDQPKRWETGKRSAEHLGEYRFEPQVRPPENTDNSDEKIDLQRKLKKQKRRLAKKATKAMYPREDLRDMEILTETFGVNLIGNLVIKEYDRRSKKDIERDFVQRCVQWAHWKKTGEVVERRFTETSR
jgi:hypothetical protein